jgi:hypothetical protein
MSTEESFKLGNFETTLSDILLDADGYSSTI